MSVRSSRRRKVSVVEDKVFVNPSSPLNGINTRRRYIKKQKENKIDCNSSVESVISSPKVSSPKSEVKSTRKSRKKALAVLNVDVNKNEQFHNEIVIGKSKKKRSKRNDNVNSSLDSEIDYLKNVSVAIPKKKSTKKGKNKKKKVSEDSTNASLESFYSASGSPEKDKMEDIKDSKQKLNTTFEKRPKNSRTPTKETSLNVTFDKVTTPETNLNTTFEKTDLNSCNNISSTSDSVINISANIESNAPRQSLRREDTFTKDEPTVLKKMEDVTPDRLKKSLSVPGSTPYHMNGTKFRPSDKRMSILNLTHSVEKDGRRSRRSSSLECRITRQTKVMFCSPVMTNNIEHKRGSKIIKSSMKGSNKSFLFEENEGRFPLAMSRKRSLTLTDIDDVKTKKKKLTISEMNDSMNRLSKPKTPTLSMSTGKKLASSSVSKITPSKCKTASEKKRSMRSKLPNFASLHKKQFEKMESLDECQQRKARRALQLLGPSVSTVVDTSKSPKVLNSLVSEVRQLQTPTKKDNNTKQQTNKSITPNKKTETNVTKPDTTVTKPDTTVTKLNTAVTKPDTTVTKLNTAVTKPDTTVTKLNTAVTKSYTTVIKKDKANATVTPSVTRGRATIAKVVKPIKYQNGKLTEKKLPEAYNRFGFKTNTSTNIFLFGSEPAKPFNKKAEVPPISNKEKAKQTIMREKTYPSLNESRKNNTRNAIKGVRTNRRFELQMKMRNMDV